MKKKCLAMFLCCILLFSGCTTEKVAESSVATDSLDSNSQTELSTVTGMVMSMTETSFTLKTGETLYTFDRQNAEVMMEQDALTPGQTVEVTFIQQGTRITAQKIVLIHPADPFPIVLYQERAKEILSDMTMEQKVGQMFLVRCPTDQVEQEIATYQFGGLLLFARDFENGTKDSVREEIQSYQSASSLPMLIAVDEEGGTVNRISKFAQYRKVPFQSPQFLYQQGGWELVTSDTNEKCTLLRSLGVNVNLAPICDVSTNPNDYIFDRSFGKTANETAQYVTTVVSEMNNRQVGSVLKHFPGYGSNVDTHTGLSYDKRSYYNFESSDFLPFSAGINAGAGGILVCHNIVQCMDNTQPASLSPAVHKILREQLHFQGVILSDDLDMSAIKDQYGVNESAVRAVEAGNDLIISTNYAEQIQAVVQAVQSGRLTEQQIDEAVIRVLSWKLSLGILT